jgi:hypothetical protein
MKSMLRALALAGAILAAATSAFAQGQPASGSVQANATSGAAPMRAVTPTAWIDRWCAGTQNSMPLRGASTWGCIAGANLNAIAGLTSANNKCFYFTGSGTSAVYDCSSFGRSVANVADAAALRTLAGSVIGTNVQAWDADLDALAALSGTNTIYYRSASNTWTAVTIGGLLSFSAGTLNIGDVELTSIAGLTSAADKFPYYTGSGTAALADLSSAFRTFLTTSSSANLRSVLTDETGTGAAMFGTAPTVDGLFNISGAVKYSTQSAPSQITSIQNDYNPSSVNCATSTTLLINSDAARDITGLAGGVAGCEMRLVNNGAFTITLKEQNASSTAANRFNTGGDIALVSNAGVTLVYDGFANRWRNTGIITAGAGSGTVTSVTPGAGLVSSTAASCSQSAITTSGTISAAECVNAQTGTSYAILDGDRGKLITANNTAAQAYTIAQAGAASSFQAGWFVDIRNINSSSNPSGIVTITATTSTINGPNGALSTLKLWPGQAYRIVSDGTNYIAIPYQDGRVLLNTLTASNSATLADTTSLTSDFGEYEIVLENLLPATNSVTGQFRVNSGGVQSTSYAVQQTILQGGTVSASAITTEIRVTSTAGNANSGPGVSGNLRVRSPSGTSARKVWWGTQSYNTTASAAATNLVSGYWDGGNGAITGFQFSFSSGNITSGTIRVYGLP